MDKFDSNISVCGLTCNTCPIRNLASDEKAGNEVLKWFISMGWYKEGQTVSDIIENGDYCKGCRSDKEDVHWSSNCYLLNCCIAKKHLDYCFQCREFPCKEYKKWSKEGEHHQKAFENSLRMKDDKEPFPIEF